MAVTTKELCSVASSGGATCALSVVYDDVNLRTSTLRCVNGTDRLIRAVMFNTGREVSANVQPGETAQQALPGGGNAFVFNEANGFGFSLS